MQEDFAGSFRSPGGFIFGVQGWSWGPPRPTSITFFTDNTAKVSDQYGRPIRGTLTHNNREVKFAQGPPGNDDKPDARKGLATHAQVIEALDKENVDWKTLTCAGFPQIPYEELKKLPALPPTPIEELLKIKDKVLRRDAIRIRREANEAIEKEREEAGVLLEEGEE